ncbi:hypothetical protein EON80_27820 [bacterium]|nr:MAG: hypothetical protein EON80_27820 [bacterium]
MSEGVPRLGLVTDGRSLVLVAVGADAVGLFNSVWRIEKGLSLGKTAHEDIDGDGNIYDVAVVGTEYGGDFVVGREAIALPEQRVHINVDFRVGLFD